MTNSVDPDQTPHSVASDLGLHYLQDLSVRILRINTVNMMMMMMIIVIVIIIIIMLLLLLLLLLLFVSECFYFFMFLLIRNPKS